MNLGSSNEWCTLYKPFSRTVKIEQIKDGVVHFSQNRVVHLHHSGAPKSITEYILTCHDKRRVDCYRHQMLCVVRKDAKLGMLISFVIRNVEINYQRLIIN